MNNKIHFIYAKGNEPWSTPHSLITEFESRGWEVKIINTLVNGKLSDENLIDYVNNYDLHKPDIILYMDWGQFDSPFLDKSHFPDSICIMESGDDPQNFEKNFLKSSKFDGIFTPDLDSFREYISRDVKNVLWMTHWADTRIHYPIESDNRFKAVSSRGQGGSQFLDNLELITEGSFVNRNGFMGLDHTKFLCMSPIVVQNSRWGEITRRIFEAMACKRLVITDHLHSSKGLDNYEISLFREDDEIVFYDSMEECISKINYYHTRPDLAAKIAENSYNKVIKYHTSKNRVDQILGMYHNIKMYKYA